MMQSLLEAMLRQADKVERFKRHQRSTDGLHAKYSAHTKGLVVTDAEWVSRGRAGQQKQR